ncbi:MAG: MarR family winged helix-turn-helix transcriptional regulator [Sporichthyaceae bacterium]
MTDHVAPRWLTEHEQLAWRGSLSMWARLQSALAREMADGSELSMSDFAVLVTLTEACGGAVRAFSLARELDWEKSRLSHQLARMERRGLIDRAGCSEDGRGQIVTATAAGRAAIEAAAPAHVEAVRRLFLDHLTPTQIDALAAISASVLPVLGAPAIKSAL